MEGHPGGGETIFLNRHSCKDLRSEISFPRFRRLGETKLKSCEIERGSVLQDLLGFQGSHVISIEQDPL
jgi:hypothetical protein